MTNPTNQEMLERFKNRKIAILKVKEWKLKNCATRQEIDIYKDWFDGREKEVNEAIAYYEAQHDQS